MTERDTLLKNLHEICMEYPGAEEIWEGSVGDPVYKVNGKIFAMQHQVDDRYSLWVKAPPGAQEAYIQSEPDRYFKPPYVGPKGWVGAWVSPQGNPDWPAIEDMIDESYRLVAPRRLVAQLDGS